MKKYLFYALILILPLFLTACTKVTKPNESPDKTKDAQVTREDTPKKEGNVFTSIADAVQRAIPIKCDYTTDKGEKVITYIKGKTVYMEGQDEVTKDTRSLITDDKMYFWSVSKKEGMIMSIKKESADDKSSIKMGEESIQSSDDVVKVLQQAQNKCVPAAIDDSVFSVPSDVNFTPFNW